MERKGEVSVFFYRRQEGDTTDFEEFSRGEKSLKNLAAKGFLHNDTIQPCGSNVSRTVSYDRGEQSFIINPF
jgi:hypothetical protein